MGISRSRIPYYTIFYILVIGFSAQPLQAQTDLPSEEIEVIKDFDARLIDAKKLKISPKLPPLDTAVKQYQYQISASTPQLEYEPPNIRPLAMRTEKTPQQYNGFIKAGYGFPNAPYGELGYHFLTKSDAGLALHARHISGNNKDIEDQKFMDNDVSLNGSYFVSDALSINGSTSYSLDDVYFYGVDRSEPLPIFIDPIRRRYHTFEFKANTHNSERLAGDINYFASFDFYRHTDGDLTKENAFILHFGGEKWIAGKHPVGLEIITDFSTLNELSKSDLNNFFLIPNFTYRGDLYKIKIAVNIASHDEEYFFFPQIEGSVKILGNTLIVMGGLTGSLEKNNFRSLSDYNPFIISTNLDIRNTKYNHYYAGVKGKVKMLEYSAKIGYKPTEDLALFAPDVVKPRKFQTLYDDVNIFHIEGVFRAQPVSGLDIGLTIAKQFYDLDTQDKAWHLPGFESNLFATYNSPDNKLRLKGDLYLQSAVHVPVIGGGSKKLNSLFDLSLGIDYFFTEKLGAFAKFNNLAGNKYKRWQEYETYGINAVAGIQARF